MYAIIEDGGRQYRVKAQDTIQVDIRHLAEGTERIEFDRVMLLGNEEAADQTRIGQPWVEGAKVIGRVHGEVKGDKLIVQKAKRRKGYRLKKGHRQRHLEVTIEKIEG